MSPQQIRDWPAADVKRMAGFLTLQNQRERMRGRQSGKRTTRW